jgi:hypothetical protein
MTRALLAVIVLAAGCGSRTSATAPGEDPPMTTHDPSTAGGCASASPALRTALSQPIESYGLPQDAGHQALAKIGATPGPLLAIGKDATCPNAIRFAAFEGWIGLVGESELGKVDDATAAAIASVQAEAIRTADDGSPWSLPSAVTASHLSRHLIVLGRRVVPKLKPLLDDTRELPYTGSETAAIASLRKVRVNDLAAAIIATIVGVPYQDAPGPAARDPQIAELRK